MGAGALADVQILLYILSNLIGISSEILANLAGIFSKVLAYLTGIFGEILLNIIDIFGQIFLDLLEIFHHFRGAVLKFPLDIISGFSEFFHPLAKCPGKFGNFLGSKQQQCDQNSKYDLLPANK